MDATFARFANPDHCHHAARVPLRRAMRKEQFPLALRASAHNLNRSRAQAAVQQLPPVGFNQIHVQAGPDGRMAGGALRQKQHGVPRFDGVGRKDLVEKLTRIRKLRFEF
jgi:hypothetical protein